MHPDIGKGAWELRKNLSAESFLCVLQNAGYCRLRFVKRQCSAANASRIRDRNNCFYMDRFHQLNVPCQNLVPLTIKELMAERSKKHYEFQNHENWSFDQISVLYIHIC